MALPTEEDLRILAANIGLGWKKIATFLRFKWSTIQQFEANHPNYSEDAIFEMFNTWRNKQSTNKKSNSTEELRTALKKADQHLICDKLFPSNESRSTSIILDLRRCLQDVENGLSELESIENLDMQLKEKQKVIDQLRLEKEKQESSLQKKFTKTLDEYATNTAEVYQKIIDEFRAEQKKQEQKLAEASIQGKQMKEEHQKTITIYQHNCQTVQNQFLSARKENEDLMKENKGSEEKLASLQQQLHNYQMEQEKATKKLNIFTQKYELQEKEKSQLQQKVKKTKRKMSRLLKEKEHVTEELDQAKIEASLKEEGYQKVWGENKTAWHNYVNQLLREEHTKKMKETASLQKQFKDTQEKMDFLKKEKDEVTHHLKEHIKWNEVLETVIVRLKKKHTRSSMKLRGYSQDVQAKKTRKPNLLQDRLNNLGKQEGCCCITQGSKKRLILRFQRQGRKTTTDFKIKKMIIH